MRAPGDEYREVKANTLGHTRMTGWVSKGTAREVKRGVGFWKPGKEALQGGREHIKCCCWLEQDVDPRLTTVQHSDDTISFMPRSQLLQSHLR